LSTNLNHIMIDQYITAFRSFNRFYTAYLGVLNKHYMNSKYSLPQSRVLQAIYRQDGITSTEIIAQLNIDKSYLSRILVDFEKKKLLTKKASPEDGRVMNLYLTKTGRKEYAAIDEASDEQVKHLLAQLTEDERKTVVKSMSQIQKTLAKYKL
jgi:DNA-binding MarR family transcriptional regulator